MLPPLRSQMPVSSICSPSGKGKRRQDDNKAPDPLIREQEAIRCRVNAVQRVVDETVRSFLHVRRVVLQQHAAQIKPFIFPLDFEACLSAWVHDTDRGFASRSREQTLAAWISSNKARKFADFLYPQVLTAIQSHAVMVAKVLSDLADERECILHYLVSETYSKVLKAVFSAGNGAGNRPVFCDKSFEKKHTRLVHMLGSILGDEASSRPREYKPLKAYFVRKFEERAKLSFASYCVRVRMALTAQSENHGVIMRHKAQMQQLQDRFSRVSNQAAQLRMQVAKLELEKKAWEERSYHLQAQLQAVTPSGPPFGIEPVVSGDNSLTPPHPNAGANPSSSVLAVSVPGIANETTPGPEFMTPDLSMPNALMDSAPNSAFLGGTETRGVPFGPYGGFSPSVASSNPQFSSWIPERSATPVFTTDHFTVSSQTYQGSSFLPDNQSWM